MAGPENVAFAELCRNANHRLIEALDYVDATPHPGMPLATAEQAASLAKAKRLIQDARRELERCYR